MTTAPDTAPVELGRSPDARALKRQILDLVAEYTRVAHGPSAFVAGRTPVRFAGRVFDDHEVTYLVDAALDFWLTAGPYANRLERRLAQVLGLRHCSLVNSGSSANLIAFMALTSHQLGDRRIQRGDEVITVAAGFPTTVAPIVQHGAVPVFVDVRADTVNIDTDQLEAAVGPRTKAVMVAHTLGNPFDIDAVLAFCQRHGLWLVEDNCDALGSRYLSGRDAAGAGDRLTGSFGHVSTSSFYPAHHITTGEGGAVFTDDDGLARIIESFRDWGRDCWCQSGRDNTCGNRFCQTFGTLPSGYDHKYVYSHFGYNLKMTGYASTRIRGALLDELRDRDWASRSVRSKARKVAGATDDLTAKLGRVPSSAEVAEHLGLEEKAVDALNEDVHRAVVLNYDSMLTQGDAEDIMPSNHVTPDHVLLDRERRAYLLDSITALPDRLRRVVIGYFFEERSMQELAEELGVSESRISQMRAESLVLLRDGMNSQLDPDAVPAEAKPSPRVARRRAAYYAAIASGSDYRTRLAAAPRVLEGTKSVVA